MSTSFDPATAYATPPVAALPDRACNGVDPEIFYPRRRDYGPGGLDDYDPVTSREDAKTVCRRCPHRRPCLRWALETRQGFGIWGGTTPTERARMLKEAS